MITYDDIISITEKLILYTGINDTKMIASEKERMKYFSYEFNVKILI